MTHRTEKLFTALEPVLQSTSIRVREALASFIRTMGAHGLLEKSASKPLIDFSVRQCTLTLDSTEEADRRRTMELEVRQLCLSTLRPWVTPPEWPITSWEHSPAECPSMPQRLFRSSIPCGLSGVLRSRRENTAFPSGTGVRKYCAVNDDATLNNVSLDLVLEADADRCFMAWVAASTEPSSPWASPASPPADIGQGGKEDAGGRQAALGQKVWQGEQRMSVKPQGHITPGAAGSAAAE
ncbi:unnamed protein product [Caretta caretta]